VRCTAIFIGLEGALKILHVISSFDLADGGPPRVALRLAAGAASLGHDVTALCYEGPPEAQKTTDAEWADVPGANLVHRRVLARPSRLEKITGFRARRELSSFLTGFDVVHSHDIWSGIGRVAMSAAMRRGIGFVLTPHGMLDPWSLRQKRLKKQLYLAVGIRRMLKRALFLHALNLDEKAGIECAKLAAPIEVIPNGIYRQEFDPLPSPGLFIAGHPELAGKRFILFLSRLHYKKGLDYLAAAFTAIAPKHPNVHLVVAGPEDGAEEPFRQKIREAGLEPRVHLVGGIFSNERFHAMIDSACFCLPSRQEGFSIAILEAMACARPVVISTACHFPEVAQAGAGKVVSLDVAAVAEALDEVLSNPAAAQQMGEAGRRLVLEQFTWPRISEKLTAAYERHLTKAKTQV
jgi:glycosyltransferase involved in cell wall biosynthesis